MEVGMMDLRLGKWQTVLADVEMVDAVICDPPYGERTHKNQKHGRAYGKPTLRNPSGLVGGWASENGLGYEHITPRDVGEFVDFWGPRSRGWFCVMTSHDLVPHWEESLRNVGRYVFAPLPCVMSGMNVRMAGDGPSSWCVWLVVSRPIGHKDGTKPGAYVGNPYDKGENSFSRKGRIVVGAKPLWLMRAIIRDYTRPGDLVCDPCVGGGTTLLAAAMEGRRAIGAEMDPETYAKAKARLAKGYTKPLFIDEPGKGKQGDLL
jgi:site-specific DNA-methyltransferase (adenine-specific)